MKTLLERIADMAACVGGNVEEVLLDAAKEIEAQRAELTQLHKEADKFGDGIDWIQRALQAEAQIEAMEWQEPVGWLLDGDFYEVRQMSLYKDNEPLPGQTALYAFFGAQGEEK